MTKSIITFIAAILITATAYSSPIDLMKWHYVTDINCANGTNEYRVLSVTPEIYNIARTDLADLRIISQDGNQIPYVFTRDEEKDQTVKYDPTILNRANDGQGNVMVTLDFGSQTLKNSIEVETTGDNFRRKVMVEGSNDNSQFFTIVSRAYLFAVNTKGLHYFNAVTLPNNDYRYLRITVSPMSADDESVRIKDVRAYKVEKKISPKQAVEMSQTEHYEDINNRETIYTYDLKFQGLPIVEIDLNAEGESFYRRITIEGRNEETQKVRIESEDNRQRFREIEAPWNFITTDAIYRYADEAGASPGHRGKTHQKLTLPIASTRFYRYMKVTVNNYDDQPITISSAIAKMIPHKLIFPSPANQTVKLYAGCDEASHPQYDLARRLTDGTQVKATPVSIAKLINNPLFPAEAAAKAPWTERHKIMMLTVLVLLVALIGIFMLNSLRTIQKQVPK